MVRRLCVLVILTLAASVWPALGCYCKAPGPACDAYWKTDAVFDATLEVLTLSGTVTWNDGNPAAGVTVFLQDHTGNPVDLARGAGFAASDFNGRFVLRVRRTRVYTFQVRDSRAPRAGSFPISASSVTIGSGAPEPLRIVIRLPSPQ